MAEQGGLLERRLSGAAVGGEKAPEPRTPRERMVAELPALNREVPSSADVPPPPGALGMPLHERAYCLMRDIPPEKRASSYQVVADQIGKHVSALHGWARMHQWPEKLAQHDAEQDALARRAASAAIEQKAGKLANDLFSVSTQCLVVANSIFRHYVNPETGELSRHVEIRDVPDVIKAGLLCAAAAAEMATKLGWNAAGDQPMDAAAWADALANVPAEQRLVMLKGLKAARQLRAVDTAGTKALTRRD